MSAVLPAGTALAVGPAAARCHPQAGAEAGARGPLPAAAGAPRDAVRRSL